MAPVCETRQIKLERAAVVSTSNITDYLSHIYEQWSNVIIDEVNDY